MPTWISTHVRGPRRRGAPPGLRADYKVSFLPGECLRISNKAAILSPFATDNEAAPRRWPLLVFCLLTSELVLRYTPSVLLLVFVALLTVAFSPAASRGGPELFRGTQIHPMRVRGVPARAPAADTARVLSSTKVAVATRGDRRAFSCSRPFGIEKPPGRNLANYSIPAPSDSIGDTVVSAIVIPKRPRLLSHSAVGFLARRATLRK